MIRIKLKRLLAKKEVASIIQDIINFLTLPLLVQDSEGQVLIGDTSEQLPYRYPVDYEGMVIGWVSGEQKASVIAALLSYLAQIEFEKKTLGRETLEKYKEITLLYNITEKLSASLDPKEVAQLVVDEAQRLIKADNLSVMLKNEDTDMFEVIFGSGKKSWPKRGFKVGEGIAGNVVLTGKAEIVNHVQADPRYEDSANKISSLMCAPLKIKDKVIGVINISSEEPVRYTAEELKILSALAFQAAAAIENARLYDQLKDTFLNTVNTLAETIEKRDPYTGGHTRRVMDYSVSIAKTLKLSDRQIENIRLAAILHDIGKIGVRDSILLKNEKLSTEESNTIKMHPIYAEEILSPIKNLKDIIPGIKYHHERFDGQGYPERLKGDEIDIMARIIAVADAFDAMTSDRPYRKGLSTDVAMEELKKNLGTQFDPEVVRAFIKVYEANKQSK